MISFTFPWLLLSFCLCPLFWYLLRFQPAKPKKEIFSHFYLLKLLKHDSKFQHTPPLWLLILRLIFVSLLILTFAHPFIKEKPLTLQDKNKLLLLVDNSWAASQRWDLFLEKAKAFLSEAEQAKKEIYLVPLVSTESQIFNQLKVPLPPKKIEEQLKLLQPEPLVVSRVKALQTVVKQLAPKKARWDVIYFTDNLQSRDDKKAFSALKNLTIDQFLVYPLTGKKLYILTNLQNKDNGFQLTVKSLTAGQGETLRFNAFDLYGKVLASTEFTPPLGQKQSSVLFRLPLELRNKVAFIKIDQQQHAGATYLLGTQHQRALIALFSPPMEQLVSPILSPFYYIVAALGDKAKLIYSKTGDFDLNLTTLLKQQPNILYLDDRSLKPNQTTEKLENFIKNGGILVRFAGASLAHNASDDSLLPVKLRNRIRLLNTEFYSKKGLTIGSFSQNGPLHGSELPQDLKIFRQILPETNQALGATVWARLEDGTPFISVSSLGKGKIIFIHTSLNEKWSNLAFSRFFLTLMEKISDLALCKSDTSSSGSKKAETKISIWRIIDKEGNLIPAERKTDLVSTKEIYNISPSLSKPAGLYGKVEMLYPLNLFSPSDILTPLTFPNGLNIKFLQNKSQSQQDFLPLLAFLLYLLWLIDTLVTQWQGKGTFQKLYKLLPKFLFLFSTGLIMLMLSPMAGAKAKEFPAITEKDIKAAAQTHLVYIKTGNTAEDQTTEEGLEALSTFIKTYTSVIPSESYGLDIETDELAFYPLLYWRLHQQQKLPSEQAFAKLNAYLHYGGTILFDTADQLKKNSSYQEDSAESQILQKILTKLNIGALAKVDKHHVLSRSFYLMPNFPGLYSNGALWAVSQQDEAQKDALMQRDGVSPVLITSNNFAAAWAKLPDGNYKFPIVEEQNRQRLWAYRAGLNIVLYVLTGSYKTDQIHAKNLLEHQDRFKW